MDQELLVRQIMQEVMKNMQGSAAACECESKVTVEDYPLGEKKPELIKSASGKSLNDLTLLSILSRPFISLMLFNIVLVKSTSSNIP